MRRLLPTDAWVRLLIVPALVFIPMMTDRGYLADFWHHLARGRAIVTEGELLDHDRFTFTVPGREFQDVNWLTQVVYYLLYEHGGLDLVQFVNAFTLAITFTLLLMVCRRVSGSLLLGSAVGIATFFGLWQVLTIRPQTFSLLLFVLMFDVLERAQRNPWWLLAPPALTALWANVHGAFPAGLMLLGCFGLAAAYAGWRAGRVFRHPATWCLGFCLVASLLATLVNPYGWRIYQYVGLTSNTAAARRIDEWVPPTLDLWIGRAWLASLLLLAALSVLAWRRGWRPAARDLLLVTCFLPLACGSVRMVAWWLLIVAPILATMLARITPAAVEAQPSWGAGLACGMLAVAVIFSLPGLSGYNPLLAARQGPRVEGDLDVLHAELRRHLPVGRIFTRLEWGEYLGWAWSPDYRVFMDGRIEIFPDDVWEAYSSVTCGKTDWQRILDDYDVDALVLDAEYHARTGLLPHVQQSTAWRCVAQSRDALLLLRVKN
jgi:hypothetical protein